MAKNGIWHHVIWTTRYQQKLLLRPVRADLFEYIRDLEKEGHLNFDTIGGMADHLHLLVDIEKIQSLDLLVSEIKILSIEWYNRNIVDAVPLAWQYDYKSKRIPANAVGIIRKYIYNQELYHAIS